MPGALSTSRDRAFLSIRTGPLLSARPTGLRATRTIRTCRGGSRRHRGGHRLAQADRGHERARWGSRLTSTTAGPLDPWRSCPDDIGSQHGWLTVKGWIVGRRRRGFGPASRRATIVRWLVVAFECFTSPICACGASTARKRRERGWRQPRGGVSGVRSGRPTSPRSVGASRTPSGMTERHEQRGPRVRIGA